MDRHIESRLKKELVIWLVTSSKNAHPQAVPVWFVWDGGSFLIHAQDGIKVSHVRENLYLELHLNSDEVGDDVVRASGRATVSRKPPTHQNAAYMRKYGRSIRDLDMTLESFSESFHNAIVVRRVRFH